ncbi:MAG TPA: hypothetical protein DCF84_02910 [Bacteroidetes bacterium]|nr:hypothetical protein [Bacteroidota bacterium]
MKKLGLFLSTLLVSSALFAQILNQPANWPNTAWTLTGTFNAAFANDPLATANFGYDDDAAGSGSIDDLVATSPVIDLSAAIAGGEGGLQLDIQMDHFSQFGASLSLEYFDADANSWLLWQDLTSNSTNTVGWCTTTVPFQSNTLDVSGFSTTQASGFQYRIRYDDLGGWDWGYCLNGAILSSVNFTPPPSSLVAPYCEDFSTGAIPNLWSQNSTTGGPWLFSGNPGYDAANNGRPVGSYTWMDFSGTDAGVVLEIGDVDISALTNPQMTFDHFSFYNGTVTPNNDLFVEVWDGAVWNIVLTRSVNVADWQNIAVPLAGLNYTPTLVRVRFRLESGGAGTDYFLDQLIDEVCFDDIPTCQAPTAFALNGVSGTSANFGWTDNAGASFWEIEYGAAGFVPGTGSSVVVSSNPYVLSGLNSATDYDVYIRSICSPGDTSLSLQGSFSTPLACGDTATICYDNSNTTYENFSVDNPGDWIQIEFISGTVEDTWDELTVADGLDGSGAILYNQYGNAGDVSGLTFTSTNGLLSFAVLSDFSNSCQTGGETTIEYTVSCFPAPTCFDALSANAFDIGEDSAFVAIFDTNSTFQEFLIEYGPIGFAQGSGTTVSSVLDTALLAGLSANTTYDVYITPVCSAGDTANSISFSFDTECQTLVPVTLPYIENFEATSNLTRTANGDLHCDVDHRWEYETTGGEVNFGTNATGTVPTGLGAFTLDDGGSTSLSETNYVILNLDLSAYSASTILELYFDYIENADETDVEDRVWVRGSNTDVWVEVYNWTVGPTNTLVNVGPLDIDAALTAAGQTPSSTFQVRFGQDDNATWIGGDGVTFDNVIVTENTCPQPTNLTVSAPNTDALVSWVNPAPLTQEFILEYGPAGFTPGTGTTLTVPAASTSATITGLLPLTSYDVYIQTVCNAVDSSLVVGPVGFTTGSSSIVCSSGGTAVAVFSDDLESNNGWTGDINAGNGSWEFPGTPTSTGTGPNAEYSGTPGSFVSYEATGNQSVVASFVSPTIDLTTAFAPVRLSFYVYAYGADIGTLTVDVSDDGGVTFTPTSYSLSGQQQTSGNEPWLYQEIDLSAYAGSTINVSFNYGGTGLGFEGDLALDLIQVETCVPCAPPATFTATVVDPNTVDLIWIDGPVATDSFFVEYGASGFVPGTGTILTVFSGTNNLTVSGLTGNTSYDFYITSVCAGPDTSFALSQTVATPCDVFAVPFVETFSGSSWGQTTFSNITFDPCWTANPLTTTAFSWRADQGTTGSGGTGPFGDHTTGLGTYLYTEATGSSQGDFADITTPLIALDDASLGYQLSFWYHMFGGDMGTLEVLVDNGSGAVSIYSLSGQQQTAIDDPWIEVSLDLSAYAGDTITVIWRGTRGPGFTSDMAIDDIGITVLPPVDYIVSAFTSPANPGCYDPSALITVEIVNGGSDTLFTDSIGNALNVVQLGPNGGTFNQIVVIPSDTLLPFGGNTMSLTLGPIDMSQVGTYDFLAFVNNSDINLFNDTLAYQVVVNPLAQLPIQEDFVGYNGGNLNAIGPLTEWEGQGSPQNAGFSGWTDDLFANVGGVNGTSARINLFSVGEYAWMLTPIFEVESNTTFTYDIALTDFASTLSGTLGSDDTVAVYVSTDCGVTWNPVIVYDASSVISNTGQNDTVDLSAYVGQNILVGFYATEGSVDDIEDNDIFIDNINLQTTPNVDAAFIEFLSPNDGCGSDSSEIIAVVANLGLDTLPLVVVDVLYGPGSAPQASVGAVTGVLAPGQFDTLSIGYINTLSGYSPLLLLGTVEVLSGQDGNSANDTAFTVVGLEAVPMPVALPNASICLGDSVNVSLAPAMNGSQTMYYLSDTSTTAVAMGDTVTFSPAATTTYFVQRGSSCYAVEEVATGGSLNSTLTSFSINGLPGNFPSGATIIVSGFGDIDGIQSGNLEQWNVLDENGNLLGTVGGVAGTVQCGDTLYDTVSVSAAQMAAWNADGVIQFSGVDAAGNVNTTLCGGDFLSVRIEYCGAEPNTAYTVSGGCASDFSQFTIEVNNPTLDTVQAAICEGTSYALPGGTVVIQSGVYTDVLSTLAGCDSVIVTDLTINPTFTDTLDIVLCAGDGYTLANGVTVYDSGFYAVNLQTSSGCDSLLAYNVSIVTSFTVFQSPVICAGQSFVVGGTPNPSSIYTQTGAYVDTLLSSGGCDSIVYTNLSVLPEINIDYGNIGASICETDSVIDLNLLPIGGVLTGPGASGNLFDPNVAGLGSHNLTYSYTDTTTGCVTAANFEVDVVLCTGIENIDGLTQLAVFPVPFNDLLGLELEAETEGALTVSLYDAASQLVYRSEFSVVRGVNTLTLEVGALQAAGVYMLELERDGKRHVIEVLREE